MLNIWLELRGAVCSSVRQAGSPGKPVNKWILNKWIQKCICNCHNVTFSMTNSHPFKGGRGGMTDEDMQEADSDHKEICEGAIKNAFVTAHEAPTGERENQTDWKMNNYHLGSGSLPGSFCLPLILVKKPCGICHNKSVLLITMEVFF